MENPRKRLAGMGVSTSIQYAPSAPTPDAYSSCLGSVNCATFVPSLVTLRSTLVSPIDHPVSVNAPGFNSGTVKLPERMKGGALPAGQSVMATLLNENIVAASACHATAEANNSPIPIAAERTITTHPFDWIALFHM